MVDQCVRLGLAIVVIALVSVALYQFSDRAGAFEPHVSGIGYQPQR